MNKRNSMLRVLLTRMHAYVSIHTLVVFGPGKTRKTSEFTSCVSEQLDEILSEASLKLIGWN